MPCTTMPKLFACMMGSVQFLRHLGLNGGAGVLTMVVIGVCAHSAGDWVGVCAHSAGDLLVCVLTMHVIVVCSLSW